MAIAIKSIPLLKDEVAQAFVHNAEAASVKKGTVNFSAQVSVANKILEKAKAK